jgi:hypothetical protein
MAQFRLKLFVSPASLNYFSPKRHSLGTMKYLDKRDPSSGASKGLPDELSDLGKHFVQRPIGRNPAYGYPFEAKVRASFVP